MTEKKLHRFFIQNMPQTDAFDLDDAKLVHQIATVLKFKIGERLIVFEEGGDDSIVSIVALGKKAISVEKQQTIPARVRPKQIVIAAVSIIKRDLFELVVEKLTELGVEAIVPLLSTRTMKQSIRLDRLDAISREAVEQSGSNKLVRIYEPMSLADCLLTFAHQSIVFDPYTHDRTLPSSEPLIFYIGPEGGWSAEDDDVFEKHTVIRKKLGSTILRTETAAIVGAYEILRDN